MVKLILCTVLLMACSSGYSVAQSKTGTTNEIGPEDEIVSKRVMRLIMRDLDKYNELKIDFSGLNSRFDSILISNQKLILDMEIHFVKNLQLENDYIKLQEDLRKAILRTQAYKEVANRERSKWIKMKKYRTAAAFKTGQIIIVLVLFSAVMIGASQL